MVRDIQDIDQCKIFIAIFITTFIVPFDENRLKPNGYKGLFFSRYPLISRLFYESIVTTNRTAL